MLLLYSQGASTLLPSITDVSHPGLIVLDLAHCFFTKKSLQVIQEFIRTSTVQMVILTGMIGGIEVIDPGVAPGTAPLSSMEQLSVLCDELGKRVSFAEHHPGIEVLESYFPLKNLEVDAYHGDGCVSITSGMDGVEGANADDSGDD